MLTAFGHSKAFAVDRELVESTDFRVRVQAALRLGRAGGVTARADLEAGLRDPHPAVRVACAVSLGALGDKDAVPALQQAMRTESFPSAKSSMKDAAEKLRVSRDAAVDLLKGVETARYVVQLGAMRNNTGQRTDLDALMRTAARTRASLIRGALILEAADAGVLRRAAARKIPVLLVDGNLTRLSRSMATDGGVVVSAHVDFSIRRIPQQILKGTIGGSASASDGAPSAQASNFRNSSLSSASASPANGFNAARQLEALQDRAVNGAVESAIASVGSEIATLAK